MDNILGHGKRRAQPNEDTVGVKSSRARKGKDASDPPVGAPECKPHQYDVFINHRGPDVKKTFVAHLDDALRWAGFRPFLDAKDIGKGRHVFKSIDQALKGACVHVAIFSQRYAESKYCLNELCDMLNSGKPILPVFYHVNAEDLRWIEKGPFKEGFKKHMTRGRKEEVKKWKEALCKVADYRGFRLDEVNGDEMQVIRSILVEVRNALPTTLLPAKQRYGMEQSMKNVLNTLESVSVLGLVGMGGIGKTTLATEIYNHFVSRCQFERYCFLKDVRSSEVSQLQHNLLKDLGQRSDLRSISPEEYRRMLDGLMRQRVLVVVDDIDQLSQFAALIPDIQVILGSDSRIVITSRQRDVLNLAMAGAGSAELYEVPTLSKRVSRCLFNRHAFLSETASKGFGELAARVADACGGHALSLEVIGASLFDKKDFEDMGIWSEAVQALQENDDIFGKLRSAYDRLPSDGDRVMFRDIACMLIGMEKDVALTIWKSCNSPRHHCRTSNTPALTAFRRLIDRSLVTLDKDGKLRIHDVLRDMGRDIVKKESGRPERWTHLWDAACAAKVLGRGKRNSNTRGMSLAVMADTTNKEFRSWLSFEGGVSCEASQLTSMGELHLLRLDGCHVVVSDDFSSWPRELRWLQWRYCCLTRFPSQLNLPNLVVLDLSHSKKLIQLWENDAHVQLPLLESLDLSECYMLKELAENVGQNVPKLKRMLMRACKELRRLPDSIGHLTGLELLDLRHCRELVILPDAIGELGSLRTLLLEWCPKLRQLPEGLGKLSNLETLDVSLCLSLSKLPASIGGLKTLKDLNTFASEVKNLPAAFGVLTSLTSFSAQGLRCVPEFFQRLQALTYLSISFGSGDLGDLGTLAALKHILLWWHATITSLPKSLGNLKWLVSLEMSRCPELLTVEALPEGLEQLDLSNCEKLTVIPSLAAMRSLVKLNLRDCKSLRHLSGLECITTLEEVDVSGCGSIEGCRIDGLMNSALHKCSVSGSKVSVAYNNRWLERKPAVQVIDWFGNAIAPLSNGMVYQLELSYGKWELVLQATISSKAECIALIWCLAIIPSKVNATYYFKWNVEVWRGGQLVVKSLLFPGVYIRVSFGKQVHLWTLRREYHVVQALQVGDQICVRLNALEGGMAEMEGGICVVHIDDEKLVMSVNSEVLSVSVYEDLALQLGELVLGDKCEEVVSSMAAWEGREKYH